MNTGIQQNTINNTYKNAYDYSGLEYCKVILDQISAGKKVISDICLDKGVITPFIQTHLERITTTEELLELKENIENRTDSIEGLKDHDAIILGLYQFCLFTSRIEKILNSKK